jgi:hypothetical protein
MRYVVLLSLGLMSCGKDCFNKKYMRSSGRNDATSEKTVTICRIDYQSNRHEVVVPAGQTFSYDWEWKKDYENVDYDIVKGTCGEPKDEREYVPFYLDSASKVTSKLCLRSGMYAIVDASASCPNNYSEVIETCPNL